MTATKTSESLSRRHHDVATVFGQPFSRITSSRALERCEELIRNNANSHIVTANVDFLARAEKQSSLRKLLFQADEVFCDGMPLVWASRFNGGRKLPERVTGSDLVPKLLQKCGERNYRVFFFGSDEETLSSLSAHLEANHPGLEIAGTISPPMGEIEDWPNEKYVEEIRNARPHLLLAALGFPKQDLWIQQFADQTGVPLSIGIGASLDFIVGKQTRSPRWIQKIGMEWFWRMATDPKRLVQRYAHDAVVLAKLVVKQILWSVAKRSPWFPRRPGQSHALLNGQDLSKIEVVEFSSDGAFSVRSPVEQRKAVVCDCSALRMVEQSVIDQINSVAREADANGIPFAIFSPPLQLKFWMRLFSVSSLYSCFENPLALDAAIGKSTDLKLPPTMDEPFIAPFRRAVRETLQGTHDTLCLEVTQTQRWSRRLLALISEVRTAATAAGKKFQCRLPAEHQDIVEILGWDTEEFSVID